MGEMLFVAYVVVVLVSVCGVLFAHGYDAAEVDAGFVAMAVLWPVVLVVIVVIGILCLPYQAGRWASERAAKQKAERS
jgi:uncharacterized membrane protein